MAIIICGYYNFKILFSEKNKSQQCIMSYLCKKMSDSFGSYKNKRHICIRQNCGYPQKYRIIWK